jgi:hypothetical protein
VVIDVRKIQVLERQLFQRFQRRRNGYLSPLDAFQKLLNTILANHVMIS